MFAARRASSTSSNPVGIELRCPTSFDGKQSSYPPLKIPGHTKRQKKVAPLHAPGGALRPTAAAPCRRGQESSGMAVAIDRAGRGRTGAPRIAERGMTSRGAAPSGQQYVIERTGEWYRVLGHGILVWEETLREADTRRAELEWPGDRRCHLISAERERSGRSGGSIRVPGIFGGPGRSLLVSITPPGGRVCSFDCVGSHRQANPAARSSDPHGS